MDHTAQKRAKVVLGSYTHQVSNTQLDSASYSTFLFSKVDRRLFIQFLSFALGTVGSRNHDSLLVTVWPIMFDARLHEDVYR